MKRLPAIASWARVGAAVTVLWRARSLPPALTGLLALALMSSAASAASDEDGNSWLMKCGGPMQQRRTSVEFGYYMRCAGHVRGLADGLILWQVNSPDTALTCIPSGVTPLQLMEVGNKYMRDNPKDRHQNASLLLAIAFREAWPCKGR
jgi:Rap1a immunity proteins